MPGVNCVKSLKRSIVYGCIEYKKWGFSFGHFKFYKLKIAKGRCPILLPTEVKGKYRNSFKREWAAKVIESGLTSRWYELTVQEKQMKQERNVGSK